jgi:hypothetical protein
VDDRAGANPWLWVRIALLFFVLAWIFGPSMLRDAVPILLVFVVALGLEVHFLVRALRDTSRRNPDRGPQAVDRERYGFERDPDDIVVVRRGGDEVWLAVSQDAELGLPGEDADLDESFAPARHSRIAPVRRFLLGLAVIAALLLAVWFVESRTGWDSLGGEAKARAVARYSAEASRIAQKPVSIRCDESRDYVGAVQHADGVAVVGSDLAILTPEICHTLYRLVFDGETIGSRTGRALAVLAHEAWHLRGVGDEGAAECYAFQTGAETGVHFGLSEDIAGQLMRQQLIENELRGAASLEYRVPAECRDGGRLDLRPGDSGFP